MISEKTRALISSYKLPAVKWTPLFVSWERRLQTFGVIYYFTLTLQSFFAIYLISFNLNWLPLFVFYITFIYFDTAAENGGRGSKFYRELPVWKWLAGYFPVSLKPQSKLSPEKNYILGCHPHGIICNGAVVCFSTEGVNISKIFPNIKTHLATIKANFVIPFFREMILAGRCISSSKKSIENVFKKSTGNAVVLMLGGSEESLLTHPHTAKVVLKNRFGFVSLAIKNGASLVPCYCFGENECFDTYIPPKGTFFYNLQRQMIRFVGFTIPFYCGRSPFTYNYGHLPKRVPLTIVTGTPIDLEHDLNPSREKIQLIHKQYIQALRELYDKNKSLYMREPIPELEIL